MLGVEEREEVWDGGEEGEEEEEAGEGFVAGCVEGSEVVDVGFLFCEGVSLVRPGGRAGGCGGGRRDGGKGGGLPCSSIIEGVSSSSEEASSSG